MPYSIEKAGGGFYVVGPSGRKSNRPLSHDKAQRQMRALYANEPGIAHAQAGGVITMADTMTTPESKTPRAIKPVRPIDRMRGKDRSVAIPERRRGMALHNAPAPPMMGGMPGYQNGGFFIAKATAHGKGKFKAKAKAAGKTTAEYAKEKAGAPGTLGKEARLASTLMGMHKK